VTKRHKPLIAGCLFAAFALGGCAVGLPADVAKLGYVNRGGKFAMDVPPGWTVREQNASPPVFLLGPADEGGFRPNVNVVVEPAGLRPLAGWVEADRKQLESLDDFKLVSEEDRELAGGRKAHVWTFSHSLKGKAVVQRQMLLVAGERVYIVTATGSPDSSPADEQAEEIVLKSFRAGW
jgi:hypothetical protein